MTATIPIHVLPIRKVAAILEKVVSHFRSGTVEPVVIGDNAPEAVIIPFAEFMRLVEHDTRAHHAEESFQHELSQRVHTSPLVSGDQEQTGFDSVEDFAASLGGAAQKWAQDQAASSQEDTDA